MKRLCLFLLLVIMSGSAFSQYTVIMKINGGTAATGNKLTAFEEDLTMPTVAAGVSSKPVFDNIKIKTAQSSVLPGAASAHRIRRFPGEPQSYRRHQSEPAPHLYEQIPQMERFFRQLFQRAYVSLQQRHNASPKQFRRGSIPAIDRRASLYRRPPPIDLYRFLFRYHA